MCIIYSSCFFTGGLEESMLIATTTAPKKIPTFLNIGLFDTATNQRVVSSLVSYNVKESGHLSWMSKGNLVNQSSLQRSSILDWSITIQIIAVLLSW